MTNYGLISAYHAKWANKCTYTLYIHSSFIKLYSYLLVMLVNLEAFDERVSLS